MSSDWSIFHSMNGVLLHHEGGQDAAQAFNASAIYVLVAAAGSIWFFARPDGATRSKLAAVSAAAAAALALLVNVVRRSRRPDRRSAARAHDVKRLGPRRRDAGFGALTAGL